MSESELISSLYLPVEGTKLVLPNVSVAEVIEYTKPRKADGPDYFLGNIMWRGIQVPLLSYEVANGQEKPARNTQVRIAVINSVGLDNQKLPFVAILTQGLPRLVKVSKDIIQEEEQSDSPAEHSRIRVDGEYAVIPNLEYLESLAIKLA